MERYLNYTRIIDGVVVLQQNGGIRGNFVSGTLKRPINFGFNSPALIGDVRS
jgi:hypothetical protein